MKRANVQTIRLFCHFFDLRQAESDETEKQAIVSKEKEFKTPT